MMNVPFVLKQSSSHFNKFLKHTLSKCQGKTSLDHDDFELSRLEGWRWVGARRICFMLHLGWNPPSQTPEIILDRFRFQPLIIWECMMSKIQTNTPVGTHQSSTQAIWIQSFTGKRYRKLPSSLLGGCCGALQDRGVLELARNMIILESTNVT